MTFDFDLSPAARVAEAIAGRTTATDWLLEAGVIAISLATGWLVARAPRGRRDANARGTLRGGRLGRPPLPLFSLAGAGPRPNALAAESIEITTSVVISKTVRIVALLVGLFIALPLAGIDITALSIFSGALGVGLGFGLQKVAANYVSGFIVLLDRSLRIGDVVTVDNRRGEVKAIESRYTVIKGADGVESIIPNEKMITEIVNHHTYSDPKISMVIGVTVGYESDVDRACEILAEAARRQSRVIAEPAAAARVKGLTERGVELELTVWIDDPVRGEGELRGDLLKDVLKAYRSAAIELPYPYREVHLRATPE